jgi:hypothetical protein
MGKIDSLLGKWASRKLIVFAVACSLIAFDKIESLHWTMVAMAYLLVQGLVDAKFLIDKYFK